MNKDNRSIHHIILEFNIHKIKLTPYYWLYHIVCGSENDIMHLDKKLFLSKKMIKKFNAMVEDKEWNFSIFENESIKINRKIFSEKGVLGIPVLMKKEDKKSIAKRYCKNVTFHLRENITRGESSKTLPLVDNLHLFTDKYCIVFLKHQQNIYDSNGKCLYFFSYIFFNDKILKHPQYKTYSVQFDLDCLNRCFDKSYEKEIYTLENGQNISPRDYVRHNLIEGWCTSIEPIKYSYEYVLKLFEQLELNYQSYITFNNSENNFLFGKTLFALENPEYFDLAFSEEMIIHDLKGFPYLKFIEKMEEDAKIVKAYLSQRFLEEKLIEKKEHLTDIVKI